MAMLKSLTASLVLLPAVANAQAVSPGRWDVTSTIVDIDVPGAPGFLMRLAKGRSKSERKCVASGQGLAALLVPDPKAKCSVTSQHVADGRYAQTLSCPSKRGGPLTVNRAGTYDGNGFTGRASMTGQTPKGTLNVVLNQRTTHVDAKCSV